MPSMQEAPPAVAGNTNPFLMGDAESVHQPFAGGGDEGNPYHWGAVGTENVQPVHWAPVSQADLDNEQAGEVRTDWNTGTGNMPMVPRADSGDSGNEVKVDTSNVAPNEAVNSVIRNPFGALQQNAQGSFYL